MNGPPASPEIDPRQIKTFQPRCICAFGSVHEQSFYLHGGTVLKQLLNDLWTQRRQRFHDLKGFLVGLASRHEVHHLERRLLECRNLEFKLVDLQRRGAFR